MGTPHKRTLQRNVDRVFKFLRCLAADADVREQMRAAGLDDAGTQAAWMALLTAIRGPGAVKAAPADVVAKAMAVLEGDGRGFVRRTRAALGHLHPATAATVFDGVDGDTPPLLALVAVLDALDALDPQDPALATLARRGLTADERARLGGLARLVRGDAPPVVAADASADPQARALVELHAWFTDWAETARTVIKRRDQLVRLGLTQRRPAQKDEGEPTTPVPAAPPVPQSL